MLPAWLALCASTCYRVCIKNKPKGVDIPAATHDKGCSNIVFLFPQEEIVIHIRTNKLQMGDHDSCLNVLLFQFLALVN